jgi:signal transduction histidine kinase
MKLQSKIGLSQLAFSLVFFLISTLAIYWVVQQTVYNELDDHLRHHKQDLLRDINQGHLSIEQIMRLTQMGTVEWIRVQPISYGNIQPDYYETVHFAPTDTSEAQQYRVLNTVFEFDGQPYQFNIYEEASRWNTILRTILFAVIGAIFVWGFLQYLINWSLFRKLLKPFYRTVDYLTTIQGPNDYDHPFSSSSTDEIDQLNTALNRTFTQLQSAFEQQKEFIQNASHELLTPLSIIQQKSEQLLSQPDAQETTVQRASQIYDTAKRMERLSQALLMISKIENQQYETDAKVSVADVLSDVVGELQMFIEAKQLHIKQDLNSPPQIRANRELLHSLFKNILHNAVKYSPDGGSISIRGLVDKRDGYTVEITDEGPGIPEEEQEQVFQRFSKANQRWSDSPGLGLAIAKSICDFHGWHCRVLTDQHAAGTTFVIRFV